MFKDILMFPGVLFHELAHYASCIILGVEVTKFKVRLTSGFVEHQVPRSIVKSIIIAASPFILALITSLYILARFTGSDPILEGIKIYIVGVILYNSFPSKADSDFGSHHKLIKKIAAFPIFLIMRFFNLCSRFEWIRWTYVVLVIAFMSTI